MGISFLNLGLIIVTDYFAKFSEKSSFSNSVSLKTK